ncbi:MAG: tripartite tricarboxylate transporter substrate binding protein [Xanthobacteraceae bacterium]|nr:tripartite tricarboxylate transporter substrate binding protein [Xanthobacteraceae bacterium]
MRAMLAFAAWLVLAAGEAQSQPAGDYPNKLIRIVVPVVPGGLADTLARAVAQQLQTAFNQQVIVENRAGGNFQIAVNYVMTQPPDGYTLLVAQEGAIVLNPHLYSKLSYDPLKDLTPITGIAKVDQVLIANPTFPATSARELIALAKGKPGAINFGTFGPGSTPHVYMEMLQHMAGLKFTPVQYRGAAPMLTDVVANHVPMTFISLGQALPLAKEGKVRILAVCTAERLALLPDVPALAEALPGFEATAWHGLFAPAGTPPAIIDRLSAEVKKMIDDPDFRTRVFEPTYFRSMASTPAEFVGTIRAESARWKQFVDDAKLRLE